MNADSNARDVHGQLKGSSEPAFTHSSYTQLLWLYRKCEAKHRSDVDELLTGEDLKENITQCVGNLTTVCIPEFFESIRIGLEMVFGEKPSAGFICGTKEAIVEDGKTIPGSCCLGKLRG